MSSSGARSRLVAGIALIVCAVAFGATQLYHAFTQVDRDAAACQRGGLHECHTAPRPFGVREIGRGEDGSQLYELGVLTAPNMTFSLTGLAAADVAPLVGRGRMDVLYRSDRPVAFIWPDGTPVVLPFSATAGAVGKLVAAGFAAFLGLLLVLWGLVRALRGPRHPTLAY